MRVAFKTDVSKQVKTVAPIEISGILAFEYLHGPMRGSSSNGKMRSRLLL
jgi:hypothetical protein